MDLPWIRILAWVFCRRIDEIKSRAPVDQLHHIRRIVSGQLDLGVVFSYRVHHALAAWIFGIELEVWPKHTFFLRMPIDLSWYSCNARGISTLEQYQRRQDGIIVSAIAPRTATVGTRMRPPPQIENRSKNPPPPANTHPSTNFYQSRKHHFFLALVDRL